MEEKKGPRTYGAAIIGNCCNEGSQILRTLRLHPRVKVLAGYESNKLRAEELVVALRQRLAKSPDEILEDKAIDLVVLACDPSAKADWVIRAAEADKHILLIPPMCDSLASARAIIATVEMNQVKCVHALPQVRHNPLFARLLARARSEGLGKVFSYYHNYGLNFARDFDVASKRPELLGPPEKMGGGEMTLLGCQAIDFALALLGRPQRVQANWQHAWPAYQKANVEHFGQVLLDYGTFFAILAVGRQQLEGGFNHSNCLHIVTEGTTFLLDGTNAMVLRNNVPIRWEQYMKEFLPETPLDELIRCIDQDAQPESSVKVGADGMEVLMAAYRSILEKRPVDLPLGKGDNPLQQRPERPFGHEFRAERPPGHGLRPP